MDDFNIKDVKTLESLINLLSKQGIVYDEDKIKKAYTFANEIHKDKIRLSGNPHIVHCLTVAGYITQLQLDTSAVVAALLHDTVEKGTASIDDIDNDFGTEVAFIVEGLSNLRTITKKLDDNKANEEFTNLIFNSAEDIRIVLIRLCEKLHNIETSENLDIEKQKHSAKKVLNVYGPLAEFLGLGIIQKLLEDKAFEILNNKEYMQITNLIDEYLKEQDNTIQLFEEEIKDLLEEYHIQKYELESRKKGIYSAYKKLKEKYIDGQGLSFSSALQRLKDIYAARIIVEDVETCYIVLGLIQENFDLLSEEFKDYIARPKPNGYKSLHVLFKFNDTTLEVQIRTKEMHEFAEFGPACHIAYKLRGSNDDADVYTWTKDLVSWKGGISKEDFKVKAFKNSVFVFTPKGLVISLTKGATPIDFAFRIHTDVGYKYQGAIVNKKMVSMDYQLKTGDVVEILTTKKDNVTNDWLDFAKSTTTRYRIKKKLREINRKALS